MPSLISSPSPTFSISASLVHVEEMDERALALLTVTCPNLESLGLHSCEFVDKEDGEGEDDPDSDLAFALADRIAREGEARAVRRKKNNTKQLCVQIRN